MGVNVDPGTSGNALINVFSTGTVPINPVEKEAAGGDPIENLLPALLQIFLTVRLTLHYSNYRFSVTSYSMTMVNNTRWGLDGLLVPPMCSTLGRLEGSDSLLEKSHFRLSSSPTSSALTSPSSSGASCLLFSSQKASSSALSSPSTSSSTEVSLGRL